MPVFTGCKANLTFCKPSERKCPESNDLRRTVCEWPMGSSPDTSGVVDAECQHGAPRASWIGNKLPTRSIMMSPIPTLVSSPVWTCRPNHLPLRGLIDKMCGEVILQETPHSHHKLVIDGNAHSTRGESQQFNPLENNMSANTKNANTSESRRDFLKIGAAASAGIASTLTGPVAHADEESKSALETINIGIIGSGGRGGGALNDSLTINSNVRVVAMADLYERKCHSLRRGLSKKYNEKFAVADKDIHGGLDGYKRVLENKDVDLVVLTTSPGFRPSHIAEAVKAGKHVFAEKPSCVDPAGYRTCIAAHDEAVKNKTAIVTGTQYRRQTNYVAAVQQIHEGAIGRIISATTRYCSSGIWFRNRTAEMSDTEFQLNNWMHFIWLSGDQITEQAVHNIDTINWIMGGPPESAFGCGGRFTRPSGSEMWDSMSVDYEYPDNRLVSFTCRQIPGARGENRSVIYGSEGMAIIPGGSGASEIKTPDGKTVWSLKGSIGDAYKQEHKDLVDSIRAGKPIVELRATAESSMTAVLGRMAAYTGQRVTWDFATNDSKLDLFPKELTWDGSRPDSKHAIPGATKLI